MVANGEVVKADK